MKRFWKIALAVIALGIVDHKLADVADQRILARDADFEERYSYESLKWIGGSWKQNCDFRYELLIYGYQTCFQAAVRKDLDTKYWQVFYNYQKPRPKLAILGRGDGPSSPYFMALELGVDLKIIKYDGTIKNGKDR